MKALILGVVLVLVLSGQALAKGGHSGHAGSGHYHGHKAHTVNY